jgi:hypothetical protein
MYLMNWTHDKPTEPGFYWNRLYGSPIKSVVEVCAAWDSLSVTPIGMAVCWPIEHFRFVNDEWAGPIPEPEDGE